MALWRAMPPDVDIDDLLVQITRRAYFDAARHRRRARHAGPHRPAVARDRDPAGRRGSRVLLSHARASEITLSLADAVGGAQAAPDARLVRRLGLPRAARRPLCRRGAAISEVVSTRCPCLHILQMPEVRGVRELRLRTASLKKLLLTSLFELELLDVVAPNLRAIRE